jgi:heterodisulfide reductase subunit B
METVIGAAGASPVAWNMAVECCGGAFSISRTQSVVRLGRRIVADARAHGAQAIAVACPLCHTNLDLRQAAMTGRGEEPLPVLYITELVGLAVGLSPAELGIKRHFVDATPLLAGLVAQAEAKAAAAGAPAKGRA